VSFATATIIRQLRHLAYRCSERWNDWRYGVHTDADLKPGDFGVDDKDCHCYSATNYKRFRELMAYVNIRPDQDVFIDYGSGLGRVVMLAATYPFRKVIGVELSAQLHATAQKNLTLARPRLRCQAIELLNVDARQYVVPPEVTVVYFWSPFGTEILRSVLENIRQSVLAQPREVTILYTFAPGLSCLETLKTQLPWFKVRQEIALGSRLNLTLASIGPDPK
jgi:hypothetical protein